MTFRGKKCPHATGKSSFFGLDVRRATHGRLLCPQPWSAAGPRMAGKKKTNRTAEERTQKGDPL
jgi:hypothetical protein